mmetsp:Transcript_29171/g.32394  ORF Transcript_29171/g.32394 Transcript_29171/m.32394 type:complete len:458 (+) Transcript_29171:165-1538(+)
MSSKAPLMVSISGVRGIAGKSLTPVVINKYVAAFATVQRKTRPNGKIIVGRDSRVSGHWVTSVVIGVLNAMGYDTVEVGIVPTPTVQVMVQHYSAVGGVIITSSHNPVEWNGLKFVDADGLFISPEKVAEFIKVADAGEFTYVTPPTTYGHSESITDANDIHIKKLLALPYIDTTKIAAKKFKVVLDTVNGAGGPIMTKLLETLGCQVIPLNTDPTGVFAHMPEPIPSHLSQLCDAVKQNSADLGIATDPDVDRCVFIDEKGVPIGEEYTLAMAVKFFLAHKKGAVCKNLSSSRAVDDIAKEYGCETFATPVGEIHVAKKMQEIKAVIGGEGNGGVMLPDLHIGRDAPVAATLALQLLSQGDATLSQLKASLPQWEIVKLKVPVTSNADEVIESVAKEWRGNPDAKLSSVDGTRIDTADWWVHLRKSNTEPVVRVIAEAADAATATKVAQQFMDKMK